MKKLRTAETLALTDMAAGIIHRHNLETCAVHVRCDQPEGEPYYIGIRVSTLAQLLAWCDHHGDAQDLTLYQTDKGANVHYGKGGIMRDGAQWHVWMHAPHASLSDLFPGVDINAERLRADGTMVGRVTVENLRSVVKP